MKRFLAVVCAALALSAFDLATAAAAPGWTSYHHDGARTGVADGSASLQPAHLAWSSAGLTGEVYGQPLLFDGRVYVGTESDVVYALDAVTGKVLWRTVTGTPTPAGALPCGDISPTVGITSTMALDPGLDRVFAVEEDYSSGQVRHYLVAMNAFTGAVAFRTLVDPARMLSDGAQNHLQRTGLALAGGRVVIGFGGNAGDCATYRGWVVSAPESGSGSLAAFPVQTDTTGGAVWQGGAAPAVNSSGDVYVSTGNVFSSSCDNGNSVLELTPTMSLLHRWSDPNCVSDNANDADVGSAGPVLLSGGLLFQPSGKSSAAAVLNAATLAALHTGGTGCYGFGGSAVVGDLVYLACDSGTQAWRINPSTGTWTVLWTSSTGATGPPIVASGLVWVIDPSSSELYALSASTGDALAGFALPGTEHFDTPSAGGARVFASERRDSGVGGVAAFAGPQAPFAATVGTNHAVYLREPGRFLNLGGVAAAAPNLVEWQGRTYVFVVGSNHRVYVRTTSLGWRALGPGYCLGTSAFISSNDLTVACQSPNRSLYSAQATMPASGLPSVTSWTGLGGRLTSAPAVAAVGGKVVFVVDGGTDNGRDVYERTATTGWSLVPYDCISAPALSTGPYSTFFSCVGTNHQLYWSQNLGHVYSAGGYVDGTPGIAAAPDGTAWAFAVSSNKGMYETAVGSDAGPGWAALGGSCLYGIGAVET